MYKTNISILLVFLLRIAATETFGQAATQAVPDVGTIVNKANLMAYYQGDNGKSHVRMTITAYSNMEEKKVRSTRLREFNILRSDVADGGDQKYYVYFRKPADVRKMVFMVHKHADIKKDDDRWLYLPSLDLVKRIAAGDKRTSFVGSDFLYEDVSGRSLAEDNHELIQTNDKHFIVKNVPKAPKTVEFNYYNVWIDRKSYMPIKMEFFDRKDRLYRRIEALEIKTIQKFTTVVKSLVTDFDKNSTTLMEFSKIKYDIKLKNIFTERYLRRPPREAIR
ncbi:MAG: outer membrane lipoprotein-sorting protein [Sedimentisphaerales bacterium]|nr:outer membrane lipoprotein-sorting protein [Sedimentisphaerales bacterium]